MTSAYNPQVPPKRPSLPFALYMLIAAVVCVRIATTYKPSLHTVLLICFSLAALLMICASFLRKQCRTSLHFTVLMWLCCSLVLLTLTLQLESIKQNASLLQSVPVATLDITVVGQPTKNKYGYTTKARVSSPQIHKAYVWLRSKVSYEEGSVVNVVGRFKPSTAAYDTTQGICGSISVIYELTHSFNQNLATYPQQIKQKVVASFESSSSPVRTLLCACVCADTKDLDRYNLRELFAICGVSHVLAVSGSHLSIVSSMLGAILIKVPISTRLRQLLLCLILGIYVLFCGMPLSALRAWLMNICAFGAYLTKRRSDPLTAVSIVCLIQILINPLVAFSLGYLLSACSVIALCMFSNYVRYALDVLTSTNTKRFHFSKRLKKWMSSVRNDMLSIVSATLVCQMSTIAFTLPVFYQLSLIAPLSSLVIAVLFPLYVCIGVVAGIFFWCAPLQLWILSICDLLGSVLIYVLKLLSAIPYAAIPASVDEVPALVILFVCAFALYVLWPQLTKPCLMWVSSLICVSIVTCLVFWRYYLPPTLTVLDIGQGDAILIRDGQSSVLVDTGPDRAIRAALARQHVLHLDAVVITHAHEDHYGGLDEVLKMVDVDCVIVGAGVQKTVEGLAIAQLTSVPLKELHYSDSIVVGSFTCSMVWPHDIRDGTHNADSLELLVQRNSDTSNFVALLTGDAEQDELASILKAGDVGDIDVLKVGHHGSAVSITSEQAQLLSPEYALISAGKNNEFGHPRQECLRALKASNTNVLCTYETGDICLRINDLGYELCL